MVTPDYFHTLRVADGARPRFRRRRSASTRPFVAIVNEQLVKDAFPDVDPIGRTIRAGLDSLTPMTIVGIVKDVRTRGPGAAGASRDLSCRTNSIRGRPRR